MSFNRPIVSVGGRATMLAVADGIISNGLVLGEAETDPTPSNVQVDPSQASGTDIAGANFTIAGGRGTGNALPGSLIFQTATAGATGSTLQTLSTRLQINGSIEAFVDLQFDEAGNKSIIMEDRASGAGRDLTFTGSNASAASGLKGGDLILAPGTRDGAGAPGKVIIREKAGVAGTDELTINHDGTNANIVAVSGAISYTSGNAHSFSVPGGTNALTLNATRVALGQPLILNVPSGQTLAAGFTIDPTGGFLQIDSAGAVTSDAVTAIDDGVTTGHLLILFNSGANDITIKNGANTKLNGAADLTLGPDHAVALIWVTDTWFQWAPAGNN